MPGQGHFSPAMDRCVQHVQEKGHDQSSAYAICRVSLGETVDDTMTDEDIQARLKRNPEYMKGAVQAAVPAETPEAKAAIAAAVPDRKDVTPTEGEHKYGDVKFADETNKKYPIDTEEHIRSAWNYIHKGENADKYSPEARQTIIHKIIAAWKEKIDPAGPPSAEEPKAAFEVTMADVLAFPRFADAERWRLDLAKQATPQAPVAPIAPAGSFTRDIIVARAGKNFQNGKQQFDLSTGDIDTIIKNFDVLGKQVPLLLTDDHIFGGRKSAIPAAGWVEKMYRDGNDWHCVCKFVGEAAQLVANDQFRGVSIGTVMARDVHGRAVGEALDHLLITNAPFFSHLNIAASESAASAGRVRYLCANEAQSPKEPAMADPVTPDALAEAVKAAVASKDEEIVRLTRDNMTLAEENGTLRSQLKDYASPAEKKELVEKINSLREVAFVAEVRALVHRGLIEGRFAPVWCKGFDGKDALDHAGTLRWFRASKFYNAALPNADQQAFHFLRFASETYPVLYRMGQTHASGTPIPGVGAIGKMFTMSNEEKQAARSRGFDPERLSAISDDMTYEEWKDRVGVVAAKETK